MDTNNIVVKYANASHAQYAEYICQLIYESALQRGTGIAKRSPEYIAEKINGGKAVVALDGEKLIGFSYIESWSHGDFVATCLSVNPESMPTTSKPNIIAKYRVRNIHTGNTNLVNRRIK